LAFVKTVISLQKSVFDQADALAREMQVSRSRLFVLAIEEYIERHKNREMVNAINAAYADAPDYPEIERLRLARRSQHKILEGEW
jgi:metal-responsive CopG/Arc/MetJ family transcriptional regulator